MQFLVVLFLGCCALCCGVSGRWDCPASSALLCVCSCFVPSGSTFSSTQNVFNFLVISVIFFYRSTCFKNALDDVVVLVLIW